MTVTDESFYLIEHGADIVFPFDIDAVRVGAILGPLFFRVKTYPVPAHFVGDILQDLIAA